MAGALWKRIPLVFRAKDNTLLTDPTEAETKARDLCTVFQIAQVSQASAGASPYCNGWPQSHTNRSIVSVMRGKIPYCRCTTDHQGKMLNVHHTTSYNLVLKQLINIYAYIYRCEAEGSSTPDGVSNKVNMCIHFSLHMEPERTSRHLKNETGLHTSWNTCVKTPGLQLMTMYCRYIYRFLDIDTELEDMHTVVMG